MYTYIYVYVYTKPLSLLTFPSYLGIYDFIIKPPDDIPNRLHREIWVSNLKGRARIVNIQREFKYVVLRNRSLLKDND